MKDSLSAFNQFLNAINNPSLENSTVLASYVTEEGRKFAAEVAAGIATIEHQRNVLEAIYQMAGKALGKL